MLYKCLFLFIILFVIFGCNVDGTGLVYSSRVNARFSEKNSLANFAQPPVPSTTDYNFLIIADTHYYDTQPNYFKEIEANRVTWDISFVIVLGDISQCGYESSFQLAKSDFENTSIPVYPIVGNHDMFNNGFDKYKKIFGRSVYSFTIGETIFIFLDSANGTLGSLQKSWLNNQLHDTTADNILLFSHYSPIDRAWQSTCEWSFPEEKYELFDLFDNYNVDYYFCGHLHHDDSSIIRGVNYTVLESIKEQEEPAFMVVHIDNDTITLTNYSL